MILCNTARPHLLLAAIPQATYRLILQQCLVEARREAIAAVPRISQRGSRMSPSATAALPPLRCPGRTRRLPGTLRLAVDEPRKVSNQRAARIHTSGLVVRWWYARFLAYHGP